MSWGDPPERNLNHRDRTTFGRNPGSLCLNRLAGKRSRTGISSLKEGDAARLRRGISRIPQEEEETFTRLLSKLRSGNGADEAVAMPITSTLARGDSVASVTHQDRIATTSFASDDYYALIHTPIPIPKAMKIPKAKDAVDAEWKKLIDKKAWLVDTVREKKDVIREAREQGQTVRVGSIMDLCHEKRSELPPEKRRYKGR